MFVVLWWLSSTPRPRMLVSGMFALLYGVFRFMVEFVRLPDAHIGYLAGGWLTMGQLLSLPLLALGLVLVTLALRGNSQSEAKA
jgi:phosphatidylglycerol:prolipoprotein diacylglycerol transferase